MMMMLMMMLMLMLMLMRCLSWLLFRAKPRHLPYVYIYTYIVSFVHFICRGFSTPGRWGADEGRIRGAGSRRSQGLGPCRAGADGDAEAQAVPQALATGALQRNCAETLRSRRKLRYFMRSEIDFGWILMILDDWKKNVWILMFGLLKKLMLNLLLEPMVEWTFECVFGEEQNMK